MLAADVLSVNFHAMRHAKAKASIYAFALPLNVILHVVSRLCDVVYNSRRPQCAVLLGAGVYYGFISSKIGRSRSGGWMVVVCWLGGRLPCIY